MSLDHAKGCLERMKTDDAFRARVLAVEGLAARMQVINAEGFACSAEEIEAASAELNDADLSRIAGGLGALQPSGFLSVKDHSI
jgi:predicted ribosomally synthesized peptide with nif11-like leader